MARPLRFQFISKGLRSPKETYTRLLIDSKEKTMKKFSMILAAVVAVGLCKGDSLLASNKKSGSSRNFNSAFKTVGGSGSKSFQPGLPNPLPLPTKITPTNLVPTALVPTKLVPTAIVPTKLVPTAVVPIKVTPTKLVPTALVPTKLVPTALVPTKLVPTAVVPIKVTPTKLVPTAVVPIKITPTKVVPTIVVPIKVTPTKLVPTAVVPIKVTPTKIVPTAVVPTKVVPTQVVPTQVITPVRVILPIIGGGFPGGFGGFPGGFGGGGIIIVNGSPVYDAAPVVVEQAQSSVFSERLLLVKNDSKEEVQFFLVMNSQGKWIPAAPGKDSQMISFVLQPGQEYMIEDGTNAIPASKARIWAKSATRQWMNNAESDLFLVEPNASGERVYQATEMGVFTYRVNE